MCSSVAEQTSDGDKLVAISLISRDADNSKYPVSPSCSEHQRVKTETDQESVEPFVNNLKRPSIVLCQISNNDESFTLEKDFSIQINGSEWEDLFSSCPINKSKKLLLPSNWSNPVAKILSNCIPHCTINFKRHKVYASGSNFVAKFWFRYGIEGCSLDGTAILDKHMVFQVSNKTTSLSHIKDKRRSFRSRFVKGEDRVKLGKSVNDLSYPSKEYHKRLDDLDETSFQAGNLKDTPISKNVLKQCAYEYRQSTLEDKNVVQNILMLKEKYISELESRAILGFIQFFSLRPFTVALWTETDIELFHKMSVNHSLLVGQ